MAECESYLWDLVMTSKDRYIPSPSKRSKACFFSIKIFALTCNLLQVAFYGRKFLVRFMTQYDYEKHQRTNGIHSFYMNQIFFSAFMNDRIESCCFLYCSLKIQVHFSNYSYKKSVILLFRRLRFRVFKAPKRMQNVRSLY